MAARVIQIDLAHPLPAIPAEGSAGALWILVRFGPRPLGWVKCRQRQFGNVITPDMLAGLITDAMWMQVHDAARARAFEPTVLPLKPPSFSVIICTREHPELLERQLRSVAQLDYPDFEVLVVDNAPLTDRTARVCARFSFVRRVVDPRPGLDYARNTGYLAAKNDVVAYTDDDACVDRHWLTALAVNYADPRVACVTGVTFPLELATEAQAHFEKYGGMQRGFHRRVYSPGTWNTFFPLGSGRFGAGVNLSVRRQTLVDLQGFDIALDVGSHGRGGGDLDIMSRVLRDGGRLVYEPRAICWHQHRRTMKQLRRQMFDYGWGFVAFCTKHAQDLELGNLSMAMLKRWSRRWGWKRLKENLKLAVMRKPHYPVHLILWEIAGGVCGARAYRRSVRKVKKDLATFDKLKVVPYVASEATALPPAVARAKQARAAAGAATARAA
jgi:glycosyltransferase involved in cell wall biosynthesis